MNRKVVLSGMRPTGNLHLGHYYGAIANWNFLQQSHDCYFMVADYHALTTHYQYPEAIKANIREMVIDWIACGLNPDKSIMFVQSWVPQHAELFLILSMITPLPWLERVPSYKEQQEKLQDRDLSTYGFLGYPVLQAADILLYNANLVPVGEDQSAHIELSREIARRFNHLYGYGENKKLLQKKADQLIQTFFTDSSIDLLKAAKNYQEKGDEQAYQEGYKIISECNQLDEGQKRILIGWLRGGGEEIVSEPEVMLTKEAKVPGLDGQKMSKSYANILGLRESDSEIEKKIRTMVTDPQRIRRSDPGDPNKCPVWDFHKIFSSEETKNWVVDGCKKANIGCIQCKQPIIESVIEFVTPIRKRAAPYISQPEIVDEILKKGSDAAQEIASKTLKKVHNAVGLLLR